MADVSVIFEADDPRLQTQAGAKSGKGIAVRGAAGGCAVFGPYIDLPPGRYSISVHFADGEARGEVMLDACADYGKVVLASEGAKLESSLSNRRTLSVGFSTDAPLSFFEARLHCVKNVSAEISAVEIRRLDADRRLVEAVLGGGKSGLAPDSIEARLDRLERLARGGSGMYVGNNRVLARVSVGDIMLAYLMHADDRLLMPQVMATGQHEHDLTDYFLKTIWRGANCLDVGANFGYYTCLMAALSKTGKTLGVEPDPEVYALVRDNIHINSLEAVASAKQAAVAETAGNIALYRRNTRSGNTSVIHAPDEYTSSIGEAPAERFEVESVAIDDLLPRFDGRIDVLKIDVEGAEPLAFRGLSKTLEANPQIKIITEWSPGQIRWAGFDLGDFVGELAALGFEATVISWKGLQPVPLDALKGDAYYSGVLLTRGSQA